LAFRRSSKGSADSLLRQEIGNRRLTPLQKISLPYIPHVTLSVTSLFDIRIWLGPLVAQRRE
jgi:hypothetical protein